MKYHRSTHVYSLDRKRQDLTLWGLKVFWGSGEVLTCPDICAVKVIFGEVISSSKVSTEMQILSKTWLAFALWFMLTKYLHVQTRMVKRASDSMRRAEEKVCRRCVKECLWQGPSQCDH